MKIRKQLLCLHGSESRKKAIPNLIFIQRRGKITISWRLISVSFGGRAVRGGEDVCRLNKAGKLFSCNVDGCCLHSHNEDVSDPAAEIAFDMCVTCSVFHIFLPSRLIAYENKIKKLLTGDRLMSLRSMKGTFFVKRCNYI